MKITGYENEIWDEKKEIIEELKRAVQEKQKEKKTCILSFDLYPGVRKEEMMELANALQPDRIFDIEDCAKDEETLLREFNDYITDDRVFGIMCHKTIDTWFESEKLETMKKAIETECAEEKDTNGGLIVIVGTATELLTEADLLVYCDLTRWEIQLRYRSGMPNWHSTNYNDPILTKYKRDFSLNGVWRTAIKKSGMKNSRIFWIRRKKMRRFLQREMPSEAHCSSLPDSHFVWSRISTLAYGAVSG